MQIDVNGWAPLIHHDRVCYKIVLTHYKEYSLDLLYMLIIMTKNWVDCPQLNPDSNKYFINTNNNNNDSCPTQAPRSPLVLRDDADIVTLMEE